MPGEKAGLARQLQNMLNAAPELPSIPSRKIGSRRPRIGHENRIMNEGRVANDVGDRSEGMTRVIPMPPSHLLRSVLRRQTDDPTASRS